MIYLGADHRGYKLKEKIKQWLNERGYTFEDMGALEYNQDDDYTDFVSKVAQKVSEDPENNRGIVLGMSGQGEAMVANKFKGVRAAVFYGPSNRHWIWSFLINFWSALLAFLVYRKNFKKMIELSREHNDANVLSLGAGFLHDRLAKYILKLWLETDFSGEERHIRRIEKIKNLKT